MFLVTSAGKLEEKERMKLVVNAKSSNGRFEAQLIRDGKQYYTIITTVHILIKQGEYVAFHN